jgi:hypothetical protein
MMLHVWNPYHGWWGEGDEKFFVDGEKFPSTFGTGTEDYFGYAWGNPSLFAKPFHGQTITMGNAGHQSVYRWQIADDVPFQKSFDGYMEKYRPNEWGTYYACTMFWYLSPDGRDLDRPFPVAERCDYFSWPPEDVAGLRLIEFPKRGVVREQDMSKQQHGKWTDDKQLFWAGGWVGDSLNISLPVEKTGRYKLEALFTRMGNYGIVEVYLDGKKVSEPKETTRSASSYLARMKRSARSITSVSTT